jgi:hypothetical protein
MSFADIRIVALVSILAITYGTWLFFYSSAPADNMDIPGQPGENYSALSSSGFFSTLSKLGQLQTDNPEIFFVNTILFSTIALLLVFVGLRYLRGTG